MGPLEGFRTIYGRASALRALMTPMYAHARRRHVFCDECIRHAIVEKPACPTCRAPVAVEELAPDRLAGALVENLPARCHFSASGCSWMGKHGELARPPAAMRGGSANGDAG